MLNLYWKIGNYIIACVLFPIVYRFQIFLASKTTRMKEGRRICPQRKN